MHIWKDIYINCVYACMYVIGMCVCILCVYIWVGPLTHMPCAVLTGVVIYECIFA